MVLPGSSRRSVIRADGMKLVTGFLPDGSRGTWPLGLGFPAPFTARLPELAQHRRQRDAHPVRLLAVVLALRREAAGDHGALGRHAAGERADLLGRKTGDRGGPRRVLG